jgi:phage/conjugal plasmid C-4 type zinc finger protein, TraR family
MDDIDRLQEQDDARLQRRLAEISRELERAADDIYCVECGEEIPEERRRLLPNATRCVDCQNMFEKNRRLIR